MNHKYHCPVCGSPNENVIYEIPAIPVLQNRVFEDQAEAVTCCKGNIVLCQCPCGFVFNSAFDASRVEYDTDYQNEQANSPLFVAHLDAVCDFLAPRLSSTDTVVEIGCGKSIFLEKLKGNGFTVIGYDPAYEGTAPYVYKKMFSKQTVLKPADLIVLRHVLEHIENPFDFLHSIAEANQYRGKIYIEVPCFDWIHQQNAFWDICYEHVNYFSKHVLENMFHKAELGNCFHGQYLYVFAELSDLLPQALVHHSNTRYSLSLPDTTAFFAKNTPLFVWGAGAKGNIFCNVADPQRKNIAAVIDINPKKQHKFVGGSGHCIISPEIFAKNKGTVLIMNQNYFTEIQQMIADPQIHCFTVEDLWATDKNFAV